MKPAPCAAATIKSVKNETLYSCSKCGAQSPKWSGRCLECGGWGTVREDAELPASGAAKARADAKPKQTISLREVAGTPLRRVATGNVDFDHVLGGGLVPGEVVLLAGEPGIGKSTFLLALAANLGQPVLYVAGEESPEQIALRAARLGATGDIHFLRDTDADTVAATIRAMKPALAIIDSVQSLSTAAVESEAGTVGQVRASGAIIAEIAKTSGVPVVLVGQVTKDGSIAGPKTLEHLVDAVLCFEGDSRAGLRLLRPEKNRFGTIEEIAVFRMTDKGLVPEPNPSRILLADRRPGASGSAITCTIEGNRPLLVEVQALTTKSVYPTPIRRASGYDTGRLQMILAVLERRLKLPFSTADVHVNVVGGVSLRDASTDLALALALISSASDKPIDPELVAFGEIGLGGEVRSVSFADRRVKECEALGFKKILAPDAKTGGGIELWPVKTLAEAIAKVGLR